MSVRQQKDKVDFDPWSCSINGNGDSPPPTEEEDLSKQVHVSIEGIDMSDLTKSEQESLEVHVTNFMLGKLGKPITNVTIGSIVIPD